MTEAWEGLAQARQAARLRRQSGPSRV